MTLVTRTAQHNQQADRELIGKLMDKLVDMESEHPQAIAKALEGVGRLEGVAENLMYLAQARHYGQSEQAERHAVEDLTQE
jgi:hypothetical protein